MKAAMIVDFEKPPVTETVVGVQFEEIPALKNAHLGAFWKTLGEEWPIVDDSLPIDPQLERFDTGVDLAAMFRIKVSPMLPTRILIRNKAQDRLIQVQNGRLHVNWIRQTGMEYPHYHRVRGDFDLAWAKLTGFIKTELSAVCIPNQWEVTYVNQISKGTVWDSPVQWGSVFRFLGNQVEGEWASLESIGGEWHYEIKPKMGRLHVNFTHGTRPDVGREELVTLTLTARGSIVSPDFAAIDAGLNLGHETITNAFVDLTTSEAQRFWGRMT